MKHTQDFLGEFIGTFILVAFGCGSVAVTILFSAHTGLLQVAIAKLPAYLLAQFTGAFVAAALLYLLFYSSISQYELVHSIVRGSPAFRPQCPDIR